jgi:hypothetical protein
VHPASVGHPCVNEWHCIIETPACRGCQALSEAAYVRLGWESEIGGLKPAAAIDEDLVRAVDQHVCHPRLAEQRLQWPRADTVPPQPLDGVENR